MSDTEQPTSATVAEADLLKGLARLESLAKSQVTGKLPGNSSPKGRWANGAEPTEVSESDSDVSTDSGEDERSGKKSDTDYKPKAVSKAMGDEPSEDDDPDDEDADDEGDGDDDAAGEGAPFDDEDDEPEAADKDKPADRETDKSFATRARASATIRKGVEVSPFLRALVRTLSKGLCDSERRTRREIRRQVEKAFARQQSFNKGLSVALSSLGAVSLEQKELMKSLSGLPARGPKSQTHAVRPVQKSFEGGADGHVTLPDGTTLPHLERSVLMQRLITGVQKGLISAQEVVKFETSGIVHPALYKALATDAEYAK